MHRAQQFELGFKSEPFRLVSEEATDHERARRESEALARARAESEGRQSGLAFQRDVATLT